MGRVCLNKNKTTTSLFKEPKKSFDRLSVTHRPALGGAYSDTKKITAKGAQKLPRRGDPAKANIQRSKRGTKKKGRKI